MCGIAGYLAATPHPHDTARTRRMTAVLAHRGPDDAGDWHDDERGIHLGHRRLSIVDLSAMGHQPMASACGRYMLAFNGEIYNHQALRGTLGAPSWRGQSDTETVLALFTRHGVAASLPLLSGMFAMAIWDRADATLSLVRDRVGEKPLYCGWQGQGAGAAFLFGSELKALRAHPAFQPEIDRDALCLLLRSGCIAAPHSVYRGIRKLEAGCILTVSLRAPAPQISAYWSAREVAQRGQAQAPFRGTPTQAVDALEQVLARAVRQQMVADVPLGAFLSGGVDSSTIVALMQAQATQPVRSFAIGFEDPAHDEAPHARAVARHLGTAHTELYVSADDALAVVPRLPALYDEPFADSSQIPTFLVSQLARQHVTVALSGDAGDELFCGYARYAASARRWRQLQCVPLAWRRRWAACLQAPAAGAGVSQRRQRAAAMLGCATSDAVYQCILALWHNPAGVVLGASQADAPALLPGPALATLDDIQRMRLHDLHHYLPDDILTKVDRAAMSVSLETRMPFLDRDVIDFAWRLPADLLLRQGQTKWVLRQVLQRHVPPQLTQRPKMGFAVPLGAWLRGPLRGWAEALLDEPGLRREGYFDAATVRASWQQHLRGQGHGQHRLWSVLMFQQWLRAGHGAPDPSAR